MGKKDAIKLAGLTVAVLSAGLWVMIPAWGQTAAPRGMAGMPARQMAAMPGHAGAAKPGMSGMTAAGNGVLTKDLAKMRMATAKYATNLTTAQQAGYQIITKMMPDMGYHFLNPGITGFDIRKPDILVYEHTGKAWQLGALEWVFTSIPKTPPLPNATFGFFPAACHYVDGTFVPDEDQNTCPPTAPGSGAKFFFWHPDLYTMHVWAWYPNPAGLYSSTNPLVDPFNGG
jgi:hypothetical protein